MLVARLPDQDWLTGEIRPDYGVLPWVAVRPELTPFKVVWQLVCRASAKNV